MFSCTPAAEQSALEHGVSDAAARGAVNAADAALEAADDLSTHQGHTAGIAPLPYRDAGRLNHKSKSPCGCAPADAACNAACAKGW